MEGEDKTGAHIAIGPRDIAILRGLFDSRIMTLAQISAIFFNGSYDAAKKRTQKMKAAKLIAQRPRIARDRSILHLTRTGYQLLADGGHLDQHAGLRWASLEKRLRVSNATVQHELAVMDVKAALVADIAGSNRLKVQEFCTWPRLCEFTVINPSRGQSVIVRPDGFLRVRETETTGDEFEHCFFLEVDRSTETLEVLVQRAQCYREYYSSGGFAERHGASRDAFRDFPFRVLMVFKSVQRRDNFADRLLELSPPILSQTWLTTFDRVTKTPLGRIWMEPRGRRDRLSDHARGGESGIDAGAAPLQPLFELAPSPPATDRAIA